MSEPEADAGAGGGREGRGNRVADHRRDESGVAARGGAACELCGGPVLDRHCRIVCLNCGFQRDCSDP